jgi:hypothetical protein
MNEKLALAEGPWTVVKKTRRPRKPKQDDGDNALVKNSGNNNQGPKGMGSRFHALSEDQPVEDIVGLIAHKVQEGSESLTVPKDTHVPNKKQNSNDNESIAIKEKIIMSAPSSGTTTRMSGKHIRDHKLATHDKINFKGKMGSTSRIGSGNFVELSQKKDFGDIMSEHLKQQHETNAKYQTEQLIGSRNKNEQNNQCEEHASITTDPTGRLSLEEGGWPNAPRPPDIGSAPSPSHVAKGHGVADTNPDGDEFEDAHDQGVLGSDESDMEIVGETPPGTKH